jgi:hypothetical protein
MTINAKDLNAITKKYYTDRADRLRKEARELVEGGVVPILLDAAKNGAYEKLICCVPHYLYLYVKAYITEGGFAIEEYNANTGSFLVKW